MRKEYRPQNLSTRRDFLLGTVQWTKDRQEGSSRQLAKTAGLLKVIEDSDAEPCFFEEYRLFRTGKSIQPSGHCQLSEAHGRTSP
jgi:hypothetical protein